MTVAAVAGIRTAYPFSFHCEGRGDKPNKRPRLTMTAIEQFQRSIELEAALSRLKEARNPEELVSLWWECCDGFEGHARKLAQAAYTLRLQQLTGALA